jgi:hypothetical protein
MMKMQLLVLGCLLVAASASANGYYHRGYYHGYYGPRVGVVIGAPLWGAYWGPGWYAPPPSPSVVYVTPQPQVVTANPPSYAYYCRRLEGYYPQIPSCPGGWMQVVPQVPAN